VGAFNSSTTMGWHESYSGISPCLFGYPVDFLRVVQVSFCNGLVCLSIDFTELLSMHMGFRL
jgi:hypothetical protein